MKYPGPSPGLPASSRAREDLGFSYKVFFSNSWPGPRGAGRLPARRAVGPPQPPGPRNWPVFRPFSGQHWPRHRPRATWARPSSKKQLAFFMPPLKLRAAHFQFSIHQKQKNPLSCGLAIQLIFIRLILVNCQAC